MTIIYVVMARLFGGNDFTILASFDTEDQANDFADQFIAKRHPDYKDVKVNSTIVESSASDAMMNFFGDPNDDYDPYDDDYDPLCPNRVCCACCGCECE